MNLILTFWWIELVILRKVYQNFIFYFEDIWKRKFVLPDLNRFFPHWKTCFISSFGRYLIQWRILWVIHLWLYEVLGESPGRIGLLAKKGSEWYQVFFSDNIFIIKQNILLTFLRLLRIVQVIGSTRRETTEFIHNFFRELTVGL